MDSSGFTTRGFGFQPSPARPDCALGAGPEPGPGREAFPEPEWGLSAAQVVAAVLVILAVCEAIGAFLQGGAYTIS